MYEVAILGAGIVGVSTAVNIQKKLPTARVRLISDKFDQDTTSWGAGLNLKKMTTEEINRLKFEDYQFGFYVTTIITTVRKYYPWLLERFLENGGEIEQKHVTSMNEFVGKYDVVVNCTGLGSRQLVGDNSLYSIRGQIVRVRAPWIKHFVYTEDHIYMLPNEDLLALGGIRQENNYNLNNSKEDTEDILYRCQKLRPALKGAKIDHVWTGLRPTRAPPRVETEIMRLPRGNLKVVHNYGHGANGIVLSWGSSLEAADLVASCLKSTYKL